MLIPPINVNEDNFLFDWYCEYEENNSINKSCNSVLKKFSWNEARLNTSMIENYHSSSVYITLKLKVGKEEQNIFKIHKLVRKCDILEGSFELSYTSTSVEISVSSNHPCSRLVDPYITINPSISSINKIIKQNSQKEIYIPNNLIHQSFTIYYTIIDENMNRFSLKIPISADEVRLLMNSNDESTLYDNSGTSDERDTYTEEISTTVQPTDVIGTIFLNETDQFLIINIDKILPNQSNITIVLTTQSTRFIDEINNIISPSNNSSNRINLPIFIPRKFFLFKYQYIFNITINNNPPIMKIYKPSETTVKFKLYPSQNQCYDSYLIVIEYKNLYTKSNNKIHLIIGRIPAPNGMSPQLISEEIIPNEVNGSDTYQYVINRNRLEENRDKITTVIIDVSIMSNDREILPYTVSYSEEVTLRKRIIFDVKYNNNNSNNECNNIIIINANESEICLDNNNYEFKWKLINNNNNNNNSNELSSYISNQINTTILTIPPTIWKYNQTYEIELLFINLNNNNNNSVLYSDRINITTPFYYNPSIIFPQTTYTFINSKLLLEPVIVIKPNCLLSLDNVVTYKWNINPPLEENIHINNNNTISMNESTLLIPSPLFFNKTTSYSISLTVCIFNNICNDKSITAVVSYNEIIIKLITSNYHISSTVTLDASKTTNTFNKRMIFSWKINNNNNITNSNNLIFPNTSIVEIPPYTFNENINISMTLTVSIKEDNNNTEYNSDFGSGDVVLSESKTFYVYIYKEEIPEVKIPPITKKGYDKVDPNSDLEINTIVTKFNDNLRYKWRLKYTNSPVIPTIKTTRNNENNGDENKSLILSNLLPDYKYEYEVNVSRFNYSTVKSISFITNIPPIAILTCIKNNNNNNNYYNYNYTCKVGYSNLLCQIKLLSNIIESKILYGLSNCQSEYQIELPLINDNNNNNNEWKLELIVTDGISRSIDYYYINNNNDNNDNNNSSSSSSSSSNDLKKEFINNPFSIITDYSNPTQTLSSFNYYSDFVLNINEIDNNQNNNNNNNQNINNIINVIFPELNENVQNPVNNNEENEEEKEEIILKSCPGEIISSIDGMKYDCNNHGECYYTSNNCSLYDPNCYSYCECDEGYTGNSCKFTIEESKNLTIIIKEMNWTISHNLNQLIESSQAVLANTYSTMMKYINEIYYNENNENDNIINNILSGSKEIVNHFNIEDKEEVSIPLLSTFRDIINGIEMRETMRRIRRMRGLKQQKDMNINNNYYYKTVKEVMKMIKSMGCEISHSLLYKDVYNVNITGLSYSTTTLTTDNNDNRIITTKNSNDNNNYDNNYDEYVKMKIPLSKDHNYNNNYYLNAQITQWKYNNIYQSLFIDNNNNNNNEDEKESYNYIDNSIYSLNLLDNDKCEDIQYKNQNSNDFIDFTIPFHLSEYIINNNNKSMMISFPTCYYYDENTNEMKYDGVITTGYELIDNSSGLYLMHCSSSHLTDFIGILMGFMPDIRDVNPILDFPTIFEYESENLLVPGIVAMLVILFIVGMYFAQKSQRKIQGTLTEYRIKKFVLTGNLVSNEYKTMPSFKRVYIDTLSNYHSYVAVFNSSLEKMLTIGRTQRLLILFSNIMTDLAFRSSYFGHDPATLSQYIGVMILSNLITIPILYILPYGFQYANQLTQPKMRRIKPSEKTKQYYEKTKKEIESMKLDNSKSESKRIQDDKTIARNQLSNYELLIDKNKWRYWCSGLYVTMSLIYIIFGITMFCTLKFSGLGITIFVISLLASILSGVGCIFSLSDHKFLEFLCLGLGFLNFAGSLAFSVIWMLLSFLPSSIEPIYKMIDNGMFNFLIPGIEKMFKCHGAEECANRLAEYMKEWLFMSSFLIITTFVSIFCIYHSIRLFLSPKRSKLIIPMRAIIKSYTPRDYQYIRMIQERMKFLIRKWRHERADVFREWNNGSNERKRMLYSLYIMCGIWTFVCIYLILLYGPNYTKRESINWTLSVLQSMAISCIVSQPIICFLKAVLAFVVQYSYFS